MDIITSNNNYTVPCCVIVVTMTQQGISLENELEMITPENVF